MSNNIRPVSIGVASDHAGFIYKEDIKEFLKDFSYINRLIDFGCFTEESTDYTIYSTIVASTLLKGVIDYGILICGSGIGMSIAANRFNGIRAARCLTIDDASLAKQHNLANILCLGARQVNMSNTKKIVEVFITEPCGENSKHIRRCALIDILSNAETVRVLSSLYKFQVVK